VSVPVTDSPLVPKFAEGQKLFALPLTLEQKLSIFQVPTMSPPHPVALPQVPPLVLQPLLENAIYHGIEPRAQGGTVTITGEVSGDLVTIVVRNPLDPAPGMREGNRLALANIRERLGLMYGERALMKSGRFDAEYIVTLRFPLIERSATAPAA